MPHQTLPRKKPNRGFSLESLTSQEWYHKLCFLFFFKENNILLYNTHFYQHGFPETITKKTFFFKVYKWKTLCFPSTVTKWNKFDNNIRNKESISAFDKRILKLIRSNPYITLNVHNPYEVKVLTRLRVAICMSKYLHVIFKTL